MIKTLFVYIDSIPGMDFGKALIGIAMRNDSEPLMRNPIHQAPTHCGSSGVSSMLQSTMHSK